jgi:NADH:ubiquinone reductase (H+-translocating)
MPIAALATGTRFPAGCRIVDRGSGEVIARGRLSFHAVRAGDSAAPSDLPYRMSCQAAVQLGPQAAQTVLSRVAGEQPAPINVGFFGQCISLGRRAGIFQVAHSNDAAITLYLGGQPGAKLKE